MPPRIRITDVSPRDGLQNEPNPIPSADKVRLIDALSAAGLDEIEVSSFVSPKWVPQLGDAAHVFAALTPHPDITYSALVPNERGLESAIEVRAATLARLGRALPDKLAVFTAASQTFSRRNTNASIEESIERFKIIAAYCRRERIPLRGYISCVIACPFDGPIAPEAVRRVADMLLELGVDEIDLGDTIGAGTPDTVQAMLAAVTPAIPSRDPFGPGGPALTLHLHDTFNRALACVERALSLGVRSFDASSGGLGGCPYASTLGRRAPGNISTLGLFSVIERAGLAASVQEDRLIAASILAAQTVGLLGQPGDPR